MPLIPDTYPPKLGIDKKASTQHFDSGRFFEIHSQDSNGRIVASKSKKTSRFSIHNSVEVWEKEYSVIRAIPSSTRRLPSKPLLLFSELLQFGNLKNVLDLGCGPGRNAIYLAKIGCDVEAVDFSETALHKLHTFALKENVRHKICYHQRSLEEKFIYNNCAFDLVLDSYVFCHFLDEKIKKHYLNEVWRVVKPQKFVFSSVLTLDDEYYRQFPSHRNALGSIVCDPNNLVTKQLYSEDGIRGVFSELFEILYLVNFKFTDIVLGKKYTRSVFAVVLRKNEHK